MQHTKTNEDELNEWAAEQKTKMIRDKDWC